jgi:hypothetical protein
MMCLNREDYEVQFEGLLCEKGGGVEQQLQTPSRLKVLYKFLRYAKKRSHHDVVY